MKDLSIITVAWKSKDLIGPFIESIKKHTQGMTYEIIVVENSFDAATVELVKSKYPDVQIYPQTENIGYARGMLAGYAHAQGSHIAFMNPDMTIAENVFPKLIAKLDSNQQIGLIAPQLRYPDNSLQYTVKRDPTLSEQLLILLKLHHAIKTTSLTRYLAKDFDYSKEQEVEQLMGAFLMCRREALEKFNWDKEYPLWWEDVQICKDSRKAGFINVYTPETFVYHHEGTSFAQVMNVPKQKRFNAGMKIYFKKNFGTLPYLIISVVSPISIALAWITQQLKIKPKAQSKI